MCRLPRYGCPEGHGLYVALPHHDQSLYLYGCRSAIQRCRRQCACGQGFRQLYHLLCLGYLPRGASVPPARQTGAQPQHGQVDDCPPAAEPAAHVARLEPHGQRGMVHDRLSCRDRGGRRSRKRCASLPGRGPQGNGRDRQLSLFPQCGELQALGLRSL